MKITNFVSAFSGLAHFLKDRSSDLAKIEASIAYLKAIQAARLVVAGIIGLALFLMVMMTALIALHLLVFFILPLSETARFWTALGLTAFDFLVVGAGLYMVLSEKMWMKITKSDQVTQATIEETSHGPESVTPVAPVSPGDDIRRAS